MKNKTLLFLCTFFMLRICFISGLVTTLMGRTVFSVPRSKWIMDHFMKPCRNIVFLPVLMLKYGVFST